ncbi:carbohydrate porin [Myxococcota bacterium]|nr:carbohydrate porin [Myxococcota bacterium]
MNGPALAPGGAALVLAAVVALGAAPALATEAEDPPESATPRAPVGWARGGDGMLIAGPWGEAGLGSYGRVAADWDLRGGPGEPANVVSRGSRLEQSPYAELDVYFRRAMAEDGLDPRAPRVRTVMTVGFDDALFHFDGDWRAGIALRNLYAEADRLAGGRLRVWAGSRMYRGDDIYLFDYWPLDDLNTLGGGAGATFGGLDVAVHVGVKRLQDSWQYEEIEVVDPGATGTETVVVLDRQRTIGSLKVEYRRPPGEGRRLGWKAKLYAEVHGVPEGEYTDPERQVTEVLPADSGFAVGAQGGLWGFARDGSAHLFLRYSGGLAAYGDLAIPYGLDAQKRAAGARELVVGLSADLEAGPLGLMAGAYARHFRDADPNVSDLDDRFEWIAALRPHLFLGRYYRQVFEVSVQQLYEQGLHPETDLQQPATIAKLSVMPSLAPRPSTYARPELRLVYTASFLDEGARLQYAAEDSRRDQAVQHYLGIGVEWWWNSGYR